MIVPLPNIPTVLMLVTDVNLTGTAHAQLYYTHAVFQIEIKPYRTVGLNLVKSIGHFGLLSQKI